MKENYEKELVKEEIKKTVIFEKLMHYFARFLIIAVFGLVGYMSITLMEDFGVILKTDVRLLTYVLIGLILSGIVLYIVIPFLKPVGVKKILHIVRNKYPYFQKEYVHSLDDEETI